MSARVAAADASCLTLRELLLFETTHRRSPRRVSYANVACAHAKMFSDPVVVSTDTPLLNTSCDLPRAPCAGAAACDCAHSDEELFFHPLNYKRWACERHDHVRTTETASGLWLFRSLQNHHSASDCPSTIVSSRRLCPGSHSDAEAATWRDFRNSYDGVDFGLATHDDLRPAAQQLASATSIRALTAAVSAAVSAVLNADVSQVSVTPNATFLRDYALLWGCSVVGWGKRVVALDPWLLSLWSRELDPATPQRVIDAIATWDALDAADDGRRGLLRLSTAGETDGIGYPSIVVTTLMSDMRCVRSRLSTLRILWGCPEQDGTDRRCTLSWLVAHVTRHGGSARLIVADCIRVIDEIAISAHRVGVTVEIMDTTAAEGVVSSSGQIPLLTEQCLTGCQSMHDCVYLEAVVALHEFILRRVLFPGRCVPATADGLTMAALIVSIAALADHVARPPPRCVDHGVSQRQFVLEAQTVLEWSVRVRRHAAVTTSH